MQTAVLTLLDLGFNVKLITCGISQHWEDILISKGVEIFDFSSSSSRLYNWIGFHFFVRGVLKKYPSYIIWMASADAALAMTKYLLRDKKFIIQIQELYDNNLIYKLMLKWFFKNASVSFVPDYIRSNIFQVWYGLKNMPYVLPNKPIVDFDFDNSIDYIKNNYPALYKLYSSNKKIILYQGLITSERDLTPLVHAVRDLGDDYIFLIMGQDFGVVDRYLDQTSNVMYIGYVPSGFHMHITSIAYIGVLSYDPIMLNNIFCAPNKIFEYSYFSLPMIGNDIVNLRYYLSICKSGKVVNFENVCDIKKSIIDIDDNYSFYSANSRYIYDSVSVKDVIYNAMSSAEL